MVIPLFSNRDLSSRLGVNLARWKRWSREFLPPDPLAGKQSGYSRQYYLDDAFRVYLGGHLVAHLNLAVADARIILADLAPWMKHQGLCFDLRGQLGAQKDSAALVHEIRIRAIDGGFGYQARQRVARRRISDGPPPMWEERWIENDLDFDSGSNRVAPADPLCRTLRISELIEAFQHRLGNNGHSSPAN